MARATHHPTAEPHGQHHASGTPQIQGEEILARASYRDPALVISTQNQDEKQLRQTASGLQVTFTAYFSDARAAAAAASSMSTSELTQRIISVGLPTPRIRTCVLRRRCGQRTRSHATRRGDRHAWQTAACRLGCRSAAWGIGTYSGHRHIRIRGQTEKIPVVQFAPFHTARDGRAANIHGVIVRQ